MKVYSPWISQGPLGLVEPFSREAIAYTEYKIGTRAVNVFPVTRPPLMFRAVVIYHSVLRGIHTQYVPNNYIWHTQDMVRKKY